MEFFRFLDNLLFYDTIITMIDFYLLCSLIFGVLNSTNGTLAFPPILNSFVSFSTFYIFIVFILFCFDLDVYTTKNSLLFNQSFIFLFFFYGFNVKRMSDFLRNRKINRLIRHTLFICYFKCSMSLFCGWLFTNLSCYWVTKFWIICIRNIQS